VRVCGIAGGTGDPRNQGTIVQRQLQTLLHRGPDALGFSVGSGATIGQTRLAVMDPPAGDPPITDESGDVRVALNGEIYNFRALRKELAATGHRFRSACDTEVLAHLAEGLDPVALAQRLEGMFAFAIWDEKRQRLVLGRDRLGKKPLHYWTNGTDVVFASEIKGLMCDQRVPRQLELDALPGYLAFGYAPSPLTFFREIRSLPPATLLIWERGIIRFETYWRAEPSACSPLRNARHQELVNRTRLLLNDAVASRMDADVPLGAFLSGGIDSSAVVALMAQHSSRAVRTFCIGFEDNRYDERRYARIVAQRFGTEHVEEVVRPDAFALLDSVLSACDQPFADSSALPAHLLSRLARRHVTVAMTGDGGDEVFGGYERFAAALQLARFAAAPRALNKLASATATAMAAGESRGRRHRGARLLRLLGQPMPAAYEGFVRLFDDAWLTKFGLPEQRARHQSEWVESEGAPLLTRLLDLNRRTYLVDDLLVKADRMSMAHALEVRSPLLDHRLVEFTLQVPSRELVSGRNLKKLLKEAMAPELPAEILHRPKRGFGVPLDAWFRGALRGEVEGRLLDPRARVARYLRHEPVRRLVDEHMRGVDAHGQRLWALLVLERFLEREDW
jgi:asparagine synthase (glutamine-hydrolysing)